MPTRFQIHALLYLAWQIALLLALAGCDKAAVPASPLEYWQKIPLNTGAKFTAVYFTDERNGWLAGGSHLTQGGLLGTTTDGGLHWQFASRIANGKTNNLTSVYFFDGITGIAGADNGEILKSTDGGRSWRTTLKAGRRFGNRVSDFEFVSFGVGYAVVGDRVIRTQDRGDTWQCLTAASAQCPAAPDCPEADLNPDLGASAIAFLSPTKAAVISQKAEIAISQDSGCTWKTFRSPSGLDRVRLVDLFFINRDHGWVVGEDGFVAATTDGGQQWTIQSPAVAAHFTAVYFADPSTGYLVGQRINRSGSVILGTQNGGKNWELRETVEYDLLEDLFVSNSGSAWAAGSVLDVTNGQHLFRKTVDPGR